MDPAEAERLLRGALDAAAAAVITGSPPAIAGDLVNVLVMRGGWRRRWRWPGARPSIPGRAGLGPWTQLGDQARRLQVLGLMGEHAQVLAEIAELRAVMAGLPARPAGEETVRPWNVRETILDIGRASALALGRGSSAWT